MKTFKVFLHRAYDVKIEAENEQKAKHYAEFFLGLPEDCGSVHDHKKHNYKISDVDLYENDATYCEETKEYSITPPLTDDQVREIKAVVASSQLSSNQEPVQTTCPYCWDNCLRVFSTPHHEQIFVHKAKIKNGEAIFTDYCSGTYPQRIQRM